MKQPFRWPQLCFVALICNFIHIPIWVALGFIHQNRKFPAWAEIILLIEHTIAVPFLCGILLTLLGRQHDASRIGIFPAMVTCGLCYLAAPGAIWFMALVILPLLPVLLYGGQLFAHKWWTLGGWRQLVDHAAPDVTQRQRIH